MIKISAVLIAKNEEQSIGRCLDSLSGLDQVVVYDTGSTDGTREIASKKGAKVVDAGTTKPFHYGFARNEALKFASCEWALTMDADETLDEKAVGAIRSSFGAPTTRFSAVAATHMNYSSIDGRETSMPTRRIVLFKKDLWVWRDRIHERLLPVKLGLRILEMPELVIHHRRVGEQPGRLERIELLKLAIQESPDYAFLKFQLGMEHILRDEWALSIPPLEEYVESGAFSGILGKAVAYMQLGRSKARCGDLQGSMDAFLAASAAAPTRREPRYWAAVELIRAAMPWEAIPWLERALKIKPQELPGFALYSEGVQGTLVETTLAECHRVCGEAKRKFEEQRRGNP